MRRRLLTLIVACCVLAGSVPSAASAEPLWDDVCKNYHGGYVHLTLCWYTSQVLDWPYSDERTNEALTLLSDTYGVTRHTRVRAIINGYLGEWWAGFYEPVTQTAFIAVPRDDDPDGWRLLVLIHELGHVVLTQQGVLGANQHCLMFNGPLWDPIVAQWEQWYEKTYVPQQRARFCH